MKFLIVALALMAMFSTASAQYDNPMMMKYLMQQMQGKNQGGATASSPQPQLPLFAMMDGIPGMSDQMYDMMMMKKLMGGHGSGAQGSATGPGGMNPFTAAAMGLVDSSDLMMMNLLNGQHGAGAHAAGGNRAQMYPGMMMGYQNPMSNLLMADALSGNDLFSNGMEGLGGMALMNGGMMQPYMGGGMGMMGRMPYGGAASAGYQYRPPAPTANPQKYYGSRPTSPRGAPNQFMQPMMGMGMGYQNPMKSLFMMDAMSGGDFFQNDLAKDLGGMMMMKNMMRPQMGMGGMYSPYARYPQYPQPAAAATSAQPAATSTSGYASRIQNGKRGGIYDNYFENMMLQNWLNPQQNAAATGVPGTAAGVSGAGAAGTAAGAGTGQGMFAGMDPATLAYMEMALGDSKSPSAEQTKTDATTPSDATKAADKPTVTKKSADTVAPADKGKQ